MTKREFENIHYRDICYFIDHVKDLKFRISLIESLGYKIGVDVVGDDSKLKDVQVGKRGERRVQITQKIDKFPIVSCAIVDDSCMLKNFVK